MLNIAIFCEQNINQRNNENLFCDYVSRLGSKRRRLSETTKTITFVKNCTKKETL